MVRCRCILRFARTHVPNLGKHHVPINIAELRKELAEGGIEESQLQAKGKRKKRPHAARVGKPRDCCWRLGCILPRVPAMIVRTGAPLLAVDRLGRADKSLPIAWPQRSQCTRICVAGRVSCATVTRHLGCILLKRSGDNRADRAAGTTSPSSVGGSAPTGRSRKCLLASGLHSFKECQR